MHMRERPSIPEIESRPQGLGASFPLAQSSQSRQVENLPPHLRSCRTWRRSVTIALILLVLAGLGVVAALSPWRSWIGLSDQTLSQSWDEAQRYLEAHEYELAREQLD